MKKAARKLTSALPGPARARPVRPRRPGPRDEPVPGRPPLPRRRGRDASRRWPSGSRT
ncbi:MAG: hypothetical protein MZU79_07605 [Anaerotruncus sp.]|nr:hypothetical protein [Anaerotruncus sp.]